MTEILHAWALAPAAAGACCLAADRRRVRAPELAASALMLLAMADAALTGLVAAVYWAGMLLLAAMTLAALRRDRRGLERHPGERTMTLHTTTGLVTTAALMLVGGHHPGAGGHVHGVSVATLAAAVLAACAGYAVWSAVSALRTRATLERAQYAAMGASILLMAAATL
ncbi:hypothetical protein [Microbacterium sp. SORGH_AS_0888]|uniref:hypothetical protein n=1 Tax=Microbacterium sp. SORGH_AS_0888 TaxID=3041791 RepID=UPI0027823E7C|nr:hypothetical protein [Microbacterium sp. SORGH_AS_0888]MDQ1128850.1 hypothetical protein [Microbacterium sp. SORGH_AS_0888]